MTRFYLKCMVVVLLAVAIHISVVLAVPANNIDPYYLVLTKPPSRSLILGTSRAAQGMNPAAFEGVVETYFEGSLFNFSLTNSTSPHGPTLNDAVAKKLDPQATKGLFIVTVDPWALSRDKSNATDDPSKFEELNNFLAKVDCVTCSPNYRYLLNQYNHGWGQLLVKKHSWFTMHDHGWLELTIDMSEKTVRKRTALRMALYKKNVAPKKAPSQQRLAALRQLVAQLKKHGTVYLVRLPTSVPMLAVERQIYPDFEAVMSDLAQSQNVPYWSYADKADQYLYTDGNHLAAKSSRQISIQLAERIAAHQKATTR